MSAARVLTPSILAIAGAMVSIQAGAALAKTLFPLLGPEGTTAARLLLATPMVLLAYRPWRGHPWLRSGAAWRSLLPYGAALGLMNLAFYVALRGLPLGVAVAIELLGPMGVAIAASRRPLDFGWAALAIAGLALLLPAPDGALALPLGSLSAALAAAAAWAAYIVFGQRLGRATGGSSGAAVSVGVAIAAMVTAPVGLATLPALPADGHWLWAALGVALLSSAIPYPLEMHALRRLPARLFGLLMSAEPALAALAGRVVLGEHLTALQWLAIGGVIAASAGATLTARGELAE